MVVELNIAIILSIISLIFTIFNTIMLQKRLSKTDTQNDTTTTTTICVKIENIEKCIQNQGTELNEFRKNIQELREKTTICEQQLKSKGN